MKRLFAWAIFVAQLASIPLNAQDARPDPKIFDAFPARCIGPANMGGRICDLDVVASDPATMYIGFGTGGVFKTSDHGVSWTPIFDDRPNTSIGAVAVAPSDPKIVWVGTGEANARNSVSWGDGVHKSSDGGKTWTNMGLQDTQHIGRVVIHPRNPDIVYVAALGHVWGPNKERGIFKTSDGGKTWTHALALDENTGGIDLAIDPTEPDILYAAMYCVRRDAFCGGNPVTQLGPRAGLYKTSDAGKTWTRMTEGLPPGPFGRCGLAVYRKNPNVVYAVVQTARTAITVQGQPGNLKSGPETGGVFRSDDKGKTWRFLNSLCPRPFYYGQVRIDPTDDQRIYVLGISFLVSTNGGKTFASGAKGVHPDQHALWINPQDPRHMVLGNDGGLFVAHDGGANWQEVRGFAVGQFYGIAVDMRTPYRVYGGLQDNGSWGGPSATRTGDGITLDNWKRIGGGDGFHCQVDPSDPFTVYWELQYGKPTRLNLNTGKGQPIAPKLADARFNWSTPMLLSPHNPRTLFYAAQYLLRSDNRGDTWRRISPDLTRGLGPDAKASFGHTITAVAESPRQAGVIYVGTDDGRLHVTRTGGGDGNAWTDLSKNVLPELPDRYLSRVECSHFDAGTAFVTISRHRQDDRKPYLFKTTDFGATWKPIAGNLPADGPLRVVRQSSRNQDVLFVGSEFGLFVSLNGGGSWHRLKHGLPTVPIHDLVIHPRERDLVIGTHGRSIYIMPIGPLEEMTAKVLASDAHLFDIRPAHAYTPRAAAPAKMPRAFVGANPPVGASIVFQLKNAADPVTVSVLDKAGKTFFSVQPPRQAGINEVLWNLRPSGDNTPLVAPGEYEVRLSVAGKTWTKPLRVEGEANLE